MSSQEQQPLLASDRQLQRDAEHDHIHEHIVRFAPGGEDSKLHAARASTQRALTSKTGHYSVLLLVSLDVSIIFADFLISLYTCDHSCGKDENADEEWRDAQDALGVVSLVFSCLFMFELLASIWAFGLPYFKSKFHCFDAFVIVAGFIIDVCLKGLLEEIGSIVVVLRLWRVFKIIEEFSAGAADQMDKLTERIEHLESENDELKKELASIMGPNGSNETDEGTGKPSDRSSE
ncbi:hypothetical protein MMC19_006454 [Ptychographa xylographoides]|nr:hypothetical protein [Ptychographa xylographoides]